MEMTLSPQTVCKKKKKRPTNEAEFRRSFLALIIPYVAAKMTDFSSSCIDSLSPLECTLFHQSFINHHNNKLKNMQQEQYRLLSRAVTSGKCKTNKKTGNLNNDDDNNLLTICAVRANPHIHDKILLSKATHI